MSVEAPHFFSQRRAGILLHPTSLPSHHPDACGDIGPEAHRFLAFMAASGFNVWQMLPIGPTHSDRSPYQSLSVHAGSSDLISFADLFERGLLQLDEMHWPRAQALAAAAQRFNVLLVEDPSLEENFQIFCESNSAWLDDFALFNAAREAREHSPWFDWEIPLRDRDASAMAAERNREKVRIDAVKFEQFIFLEQWQSLHAEAKRLGIALFGDLPIFVAHDSADVWAQPKLFNLDAAGQLLTVAGVPPDYFSETGQRWGNPHYAWDRMEADNFAWWRGRIAAQLRYFDLLRIDHFRGFEAYWEIPADSDTAINGRWVKAPGQALLRAIFDDYPALPLVAENLGIITPEVEALRAEFNLPGMLILQFAFDGSRDNPYVPHRHKPIEVVYTGTHDNDTTLGWYLELDAQARARVDSYLGHSSEPMPRPLIRSALASVAVLAIIPLQDLLELDSSHRMNIPGTAENNWGWQFDWSQLAENAQGRFRNWLTTYGRI
ncbi:MAG: 4-alpha-glucanotransferase [Verrucomicrobiaceae bacterium]|nr:4-alpha-glucanotransferase [Verrucomicrobiaceae bacterium]